MRRHVPAPAAWSPEEEALWAGAGPTPALSAEARARIGARLAEVDRPRGRARWRWWSVAAAGLIVCASGVAGATLVALVERVREPEVKAAGEPVRGPTHVPPRAPSAAPSPPAAWPRPPTPAPVGRADDQRPASRLPSLPAEVRSGDTAPAAGEPAAIDHARAARATSPPAGRARAAPALAAAPPAARAPAASPPAARAAGPAPPTAPAPAAPPPAAPVTLPPAATAAAAAPSPAASPGAPAPPAERGRPLALAPRALRAASPAPSAAPPSPPASALAEEARLLGEAIRRLTQDRDAAGALALLDAYAARFPAGALAREAELARVQALVGTGRRAEALRALDGLSVASAARARELRVLRGELRLGAGRAADARADFEVVLGDASADDLAERALFGRASARARLGDSAGARADLQQYLRRYPEGARAPEARAILAAGATP